MWRGRHNVLCGGFVCIVQGGSNMTETNCDLFTHNQSRSYLNHLVFEAFAAVNLCIMFMYSVNSFSSY
jgi:hypothetical protein